MYRNLYKNCYMNLYIKLYKNYFYLNLYVTLQFKLNLKNFVVQFQKIKKNNKYLFKISNNKSVYFILNKFSYFHLFPKVFNLLLHLPLIHNQRKKEISLVDKLYFPSHGR